MAKKEVQIGINYTVNQQSLNNFKKSLESIRQLTNTDILKINPNFSGKAEAKKELESIRKNAEVVEIALEKAFNPKIGSVNLSKFNQELKKENRSIKDIYNSFNKAGTAGKKAFIDLTSTLMTTTVPLKQTHKLLNEMATTLTNNLRWNIASGAINRLTGSIQEAYGYIKALDSSLNSIQIVTQKNADTMADFAVKANNAAKALGTGTKDYTDAALTFYQQGLSDQDVAARTETTLKVANVTGLNSDEAAEYVTSVVNGYKVAANEVENSMDKISAVGAATASSLSELAEGMSKVASTANAMGVSEDQLAATLSTVISVTRQDASTIGTAFKTIYARISDIEAGSEDAEISLGEYTSKMAEMGFSVLDSSGKLKDLGAVMEEIGGSWANLSREQQISLAQTMAGTRQYNNLIALFDNWDAYTKSLNVSMEANGTLQQQQDTYMESTAAHLQTLTTNLEDLYDSLLDSDTIEGFSDLLSGLVSGITTVVDGLGGGGNALLTLGSIATTVFRKQISKGIATTINNFKTATKTVKDYKAQLKNTDEFKDLGDESITRIAEMQKTYAQYSAFMSEEEKKAYQAQIQEQAALEKKVEDWKAAKAAAAEYLKALNRKPSSPTRENDETLNGHVITSVPGGEKKKGQAGDILTIEENSLQENIGAMEALTNSAGKFQKAQQGMSQALQEVVENTNKYNTVTDRLGQGNKQQEKDENRRISLLEKTSAKYEDIIVNIEEMQEAYKDLSVVANMDPKSKALLDLNDEEIKELDELKNFDNRASDLIKKIRNSKSEEDLIDDTALQKELQEITEAYNKIIEKIKQKSEETKGALEQAQEIQGDESTDPEKQAKQHQKEQQENAKLMVSTQARVQAFTEVAGAVMSLTSAMQTLINIWDIWNNPDLSVGEKITQTIGGIIPVVISLTTSIWGMKTAADAAIISFWPLLAITVGLAALVGGISLLSKVIVTQDEKMQNAAKTVENLTSKYDELTTAVDNFKNSVSEYNDAIKALDELDKGTQEYNEALELANEKAKELIKTFKLWDDYELKDGKIIISETALQNIQDQQTKQLNNLEQSKLIAEQGATLTALEGKESDILRSIYNDSGSRDARDIYKYEDDLKNLTTAALKGLNEGTYLNLEEAFNKEIDILFGENSSLKEAFKKNISSLEDLANATLKAADANKVFANQMIESAIDEKYGKKIKDIATTVDEKTGEEKTDEALVNTLTQAVVENSKKDNEDLVQELENVATTVTEQTDKKFDGTNDDEDFNIWMNEKQNGKQSINEWLKSKGEEEVKIDGDEDIARLYAKKVLGMSEADANALKYSGGIGESTLTYTTSYTDASGVTHKAGDAVIENMSETDQINAIARSYLTDYLKDQYKNDTSESTEAFLKEIDVLSKDISDEYGDIGSGILNALANGDITNIDLSNITAGLSREDYEKLKNADSETLAKELGLENIDFEALGYDSLDQFMTAIQQGLGSWDASAWTDTLVEASKEAISQTETLLDDLKSGKITGDNIAASDSFKSLSSELNKIVKEYPELQGEQELLNKTWLAGTEGYEENLKNIQQKLADIKVASEAADAKDAYDSFVEKYQDLEVNISANPEEFENEMDELLKQEYEVNVAIHAAAEEAFSNVSDDIDEISKQASVIGENFVVSANDIRELNNTFPGILEGMTTLADGSIQLNQQVVSSAMAGAEAEVQADSQALIDKLQNQATLLRAKQKIYETMAKAAAALAQGETKVDGESADAKALISSGLSELEQYNSQATAETSKDANEEVSKSAAENGDAFAKNWNEAYELVNKNAYEAANNQISYMNKVREGKPVEQLSISTADYKGTEVVSEETDIIRQTKDALKSGSKSEQAWAEISQTFDAMAKSAGEQATDIEGMIAQIGVSAIGLDATLSNVAQGKGSTGETADQIDLLKDELDIYRAINNEIQDITRNLEDLTKQQEKLTGPALIKNLDKQLEILNKQVDAYERKLKIAEQEASKYAAQLRGYGITFDSSNQMANYDALYAQMENSINAQISAYNSLSKSQQTDQKKQEIENSKNQLEKLKEIAGKYDTVINSTLPEIINNLEDISEKEYEIKIEKLDVAIQEATDKTDWSKLYDEFLNRESYLSDDIIGKTLLTAQSDQTRGYLRDQMQTEYKGAQAAVNAMNIIDKGGIDEIYGTDRAKALENAKTYGESLMSNIQDIYNTLDSLNANVITGIEEVDSAYSDLNSTYDNISKTYQNGMKLLKLLYGEDSYAELNNYYQKMQPNYEKQLMNLRNEKEYWLDLMNTVEENSDEWKKYQQNFISASDSLNSTLETAIQNIIDKYTNAINEIFKTLEDKVTNGLGLEYINDEWTLIKDNSEQYFDAINAAYNIQATKSKYLEAINATDDVKAQQRLNKLMEEQMAQLEAKDKLTEYDVERAEKVLTLEQKKIALEEAQQNKSKMRLRRNASGDYTYQFVADEDNIAKARQELLDAENDLYNLDLNEYNESLDRAYELYSEYQEKVLQVYTDTSLSQEERDKKLYLLNSQYQEALTQASERNTTAKVNLENSANETIKLYYEDNLEKFNNMIDEDGRLIMEELVPGWSSGVQNMITKITEDGGLDNVMQKTLADANRAVQDLSEEEQKTAEIAGADLADIQNASLEEADILSGNVVDAQDSVLNMAKDNLNTVMDIRDEYQNWADDILNTLVPSYDSLIRKINEAIARAQELAAEASRNYSINTTGYIAPPTSGSGNGSGSGGNGNGSGGKKTNDTQESETEGIKYQIYDSSAHMYKDIGIGSTFRLDTAKLPNSRLTTIYTVKKFFPLSDKPIQVSYTGLGENIPGTNIPRKLGTKIGYIKNGLGGLPVHLDTGGYTGAWGADGRIAMLHQKELVLNAKDTENMLKAVDILRAMTDNLGESIFNRLASIPNGYSNILNQIPNSETLEQKVQIEAVFPNVSNSHEIENAFNNLVNIASQRALRNKK